MYALVRLVWWISVIFRDCWSGVGNGMVTSLFGTSDVITHCFTLFKVWASSRCRPPICILQIKTTAAQVMYMFRINCCRLMLL